MTPETLENELRHISAAVARVESRLCAQVGDHEQRIRSLEKVVWKVAGGVGLLASVGAVLGNALLRHFTGGA